MSKIATNKILFGSPGSGKSYKLKEATKDWKVVRTTFHPEYDYANFVGTYKPIKDKEDGKITYSFIPQVFVKIYVEAWQNLDKAYCLLIEEINRGNCAAIFGDIFQLLDRTTEGISEYPITVDADLTAYLETALKETDYEARIRQWHSDKGQQQPENTYATLLLPPNLNIWATMNTSDQSLFPMDSAFKRRWEWEYLPIDLAKAEEHKMRFEVNGQFYSWASFLKIINQKIVALTESEDKQLGVFFVKHTEGVISLDSFKSKIMFYLWYDVFKNEDRDSPHYIFKTDKAHAHFTFADLFDSNKPNLLQDFLNFHAIQEFKN